jgi:hypothetical protein
LLGENFDLIENQPVPDSLPLFAGKKTLADLAAGLAGAGLSRTIRCHSIRG